ncbi:TPA: hypothetical protein QDB31_003284 [Burkholderia vietnamiensis]|nr:hypothetical protein [Burkholderia vietnamiensis]
MKRFLSWFRRRLLVRVMVGTGVRLRAGDTVLVAVDGFLAEEQVASLRAAFEKNHPGVKVVFLAGLDRVVVLGSEMVGDEPDAATTPNRLLAAIPAPYFPELARGWRLDRGQRRLRHDGVNTVWIYSLSRSKMGPSTRKSGDSDVHARRTRIIRRYTSMH